MKSTTNKRILRGLMVMGILFAALIISMTTFEMVGKQTLMTSSYNKRNHYEDAKIQRGIIVDRQGVVLAESTITNQVATRIYPHGRLYAHTIGYNSPIYGKTLLEAAYNKALSGDDLKGMVNQVQVLFTGEAMVGHSLELTLDHSLQTYARDLLEGKNGSIVALNPKTGEVLAMVSTPDFNPNAQKLDTNWSSLSEDAASLLLPRSIRGLYPPGSTFKVITALSALDNDLGDYSLEDTGAIVIDGKTFANFQNKVYGNQTLAGALTVSSNVYFADLAQKLGASALIKTAKQAGITSKIPFDLDVATSQIGQSAMSPTDLSATAFGQGQLMVTPLQMALVASGIANEGIIKTPYLVNRVVDMNGHTVESHRESTFKTLSNPDHISLVKTMMVDVVKKGSGQEAALKNIQVAGKTGTAQTNQEQNGTQLNHAWFIGFAPADDPQIAIAVIVEHQTQGGAQIAAPIARKVIYKWLQ